MRECHTHHITRTLALTARHLGALGRRLQQRRVEFVVAETLVAVRVCMCVRVVSTHSSHSRSRSPVGSALAPSLAAFDAADVDLTSFIVSVLQTTITQSHHNVIDTYT